MCVYFSYISYLPTPLLGFKSIQNGLQVHLDFFPRKRSEFLLGKQFAFQKVAATFIWNLPFIFNQLVQTKKELRDLFGVSCGKLVDMK